jgi:hypothetical protein
LSTGTAVSGQPSSSIRATINCPISLQTNIPYAGDVSLPGGYFSHDVSATLLSAFIVITVFTVYIVFIVFCPISPQCQEASWSFCPAKKLPVAAPRPETAYSLVSLYLPVALFILLSGA